MTNSVQDNNLKDNIDSDNTEELKRLILKQLFEEKY